MRIKEIIKNIFITLASALFIYLIVSMPYLKNKNIFDNCSLISGENNFLFLIISFFLPLYWFLFSEEKPLVKFSLTLFPFLINSVIAFNVTFWLKAIVNEFYICSLMYFVYCLKEEKTALSFYYFSFLFLPVIMEKTVKSIIDNFYYGVYIKESFFSAFYKISPVFSMILNDYKTEPTDIVFLILISIFIIVISGKINKLFVHSVFFIFLSFCSVFLAKSSYFVLFICLVANLVFLKMITGVRLRGFVVSSVFIMISFFIVSMDIYNISERPFYISEINSVYIGDNDNNIYENLKDDEIATDFNNKIVSKRLTYDIKNKILGFHKDIVKERKEKKLYIAYKLGNGKIIVRKY